MIDFDVILSSPVGQETVRVAAVDGTSAAMTALKPGTVVTGISLAALPDEPVPEPRPVLTLPTIAAFDEDQGE